MFLCKRCIPSNNTSLKIDTLDNNSNNTLLRVKLHLDNNEKNKFYKVIKDDEDDEIIEKYNNLSTIDKLYEPTNTVIECKNDPIFTKKSIPNDKIIHKQLKNCEHKNSLSNRTYNNYTLVDLLNESSNLSSDNTERKRPKIVLINHKKETIKKKDKCDHYVIQNNSLASIVSKINEEKQGNYSPSKGTNKYYPISKKKKNEKINISNTDNLRKLELYHQIETMQNLEQFQQIKELENLQNILEVQKMQNLINVHNSNNFNQIAISQPPQNYQYYYPQFQYYSIHQCAPKKENKVIENNKNYCCFCEEIYKYIILHNVSIKKFKCLYCNNTLNLSSLELFIEKYKGELQNKIRNQIKKQFFSKITSNNESLSLTSINEYKEKKEIENKSASNIYKNSNTISMKNINESDIPLSQNHETSKDNLDSNIQENYLTDYNNINNNLCIKNNKKISPELSLAEAFKTKRADLFKKILQRENQQKQQMNNSKKSKSTNKPKQNDTQEKKLLNKPEPLIPSSKLIEKVDIRNPKKRVKEPSKELLDRLQNGKRAKMTKKEMKEINERLYKNLVDIKVPDKNDIKREDFENRSQKKKQFSDTLQEKVISNYKLQKQFM